MQRLLGCAPRHTEPIVALAFSPDSRLFATASQGSNTILWDVQTWSKLHRFMPSGPIRSLAFAARGFLFAETACEGNLEVWDIATFSPIPPSRVDVRSALSSIAFFYQKRGLKSRNIHRGCAPCAQSVGSRTHVLQATV